MTTSSRFPYWVAAFGLHAAILWGVTFGTPSFISEENGPGDAVEASLIETIEPAPPAEQPPETEAPPMVRSEMVPEPTPPDDALPEPKAAPEPPQPVRPQVKPVSKPKHSARPSMPGTSAIPSASPGNSQAITGKPGPGDSSHATWRNRVQPAYPPSARAAKQSGRVLITVNVNALGRPSGVQISRGSGFPALDQAALSAARASTYHPKKIAGIPLPDIITVPYSFRLEAR